ncbi:response regulator [Parapedobacter sp. 10938]|uniref:response regulator n=1 Tax=Parapedobacter flavus TaxID=3110225 RepID=UPI002DBA8BC6|nr:response regulator [Parapedobacter sp. 10938]MEC3881374.1 response regulator [Parapedobacter sp. 10938]
MKQNKQHTPTARILLLCSFIILFLFIGSVFIYQYGQYRKLERRLTTAYQTRKAGSDNLNYLFSTYSEAENAFRLYTLEFSDSSYIGYLTKLNLLKSFVDSLASQRGSGNPLNNPTLKVEDQQRIAMEFASLKKRLDRLVFHTHDSLSILSKHTHVKPPSAVRIESVVDNVLRDTTTNITKDTIVRKRPGLLKRIFNTKDDTIVIATEHNSVDVERIALLRDNLSTAQSNLERSYLNNIMDLRQTFSQLQEKERQLITTNIDLLNKLKESMEIVRTLDVYTLRKAEERDFSLYKENIKLFGTQLIFALILMFIMIVALVYYQFYARSYERRLHVEKDYAANLAEEKTSVLANISHEIRTPLNSLLGVIDLLKSRTISDSADEKLIDSVYYNINLISNNITDILSLSKLEATHKSNIAKDYFSPNRSFQDVVALHSNQAELKNLQLHTEIEIDPLLTLLSNEFRIRQIASNFLSNAIKYTQKGDITFRASLFRKGNDSNLHLEVEDSGIGISEKHRRQVFRKYFTANPNSGGIGLGLYISKIMAQELDGTIGLKNKPTKGAIFFADIPFSDSKMETQEHRKAQLADLPTDLRLLVVDDNPINILLMRQFFKDVGSIHTVNSGEDALVFLDSHAVDLVITDINMPGMSGVKLLEKIRAEERFNTVRVLAISADMSTLKYAEEAHVEAFFDGFIEKPFTETEIVKAITAALSGKT